MPFTRKILVVAHQTASSEDLLDALRHQAEQGKCRFTLLVPAPATTPAEQVKATLEDALTRMRDAGLEVDGKIGYGDPYEVVQETWDPRSYDEVIVCTLPGRASKWLQTDLPHRLARLTGCQVTHVVAMERHEPPAEPPPAHEKHGVLSPLSVLTWGGGRRSETG
jgi:nucleotide-binding universal stress UspA family protein